jgi:hypothetical protein
MTTPNKAEAVMKAEARGASDRVIRVLKATQAAATLGTTGLTDYRPAGDMHEALAGSPLMPPNVRYWG